MHRLIRKINTRKQEERNYQHTADRNRSSEKKLTEQEETIDELVQERDDVCHELFKVRLTLADAWNIKKRHHP